SRRGRRRGRRGRGRLGRRGGDARDVVGRIGDDADQVSHRHLPALAHDDLAQHAGPEGLDLHVGLVGLDLRDHVAALDRVALLLQPLDDLAGLHRVRQLGHQDLGDHRLHTRRIAATILALDGVFSSSRFLAYGIGAFSPVTRSIGASRSSKASSWISAAISEPMPANPAPASSTIARCVLRTEPTMVSVSMGRSVRGSTISTEMPSLASSSAASRARYIMPMYATTVTSVPSRRMTALPRGIRKSGSSGTSPLTAYSVSAS